MPTTRAERTISVTHVTLRCERPYSQVLETLLSIPKLDPALVRMLSQGDLEATEARRQSGPGLWLFATRDHGALLAVEGDARAAVQFEIGNPLTAERMTREQLAAGLYAPLRVLLYADRDGVATIEYDLPSTHLSQWGDEAVTGVARELDDELEALLAKAAG